MDRGIGVRATRVWSRQAPTQQPREHEHERPATKLGESLAPPFPVDMGRWWVVERACLPLAAVSLLLTIPHTRAILPRAFYGKSLALLQTNMAWHGVTMTAWAAQAHLRGGTQARLHDPTKRYLKRLIPRPTNLRWEVIGLWAQSWNTGAPPYFEWKYGIHKY